MNFTRELRYKILDPALSTDERARLRCQLAKHLEEIGQYEAAREILEDLWPTVDQSPNLQGLEPQTAAEVLLRVGTLTGWLGSLKQIEGAQETAKNLLTQSLATFGSLQADKKVAEAQIELGYCYLREGNLSNARAWFAEALRGLDDHDGDLKAVALLRSALLEQLANRLIDALDILKTAAPLFKESNNHPLKGKFHNELATVLKNLGAIENRADYTNRALLEYAAASFHFGQAGHDRYQSYVENNLAMLFFSAHKFEEAHEHLDRAQALFTTLEDAIHLAQVYDTRARVFLAEELYVKAEEVARSAVQLLARGEEQSLLAEALTTHGVTLSRLHHKEQARGVFERAIQIAEHTDNLESAGLAALTLVEELSEHLSEDEQYSILERADDCLANTQNTDLLRRQKNCFRRFANRTFSPDLNTFSLEEAVRRYEERHIRRALEQTSGVIIHAARLIKMTRQGLYKALNTRHENLRQLGSELRSARSEVILEEQRRQYQDVGALQRASTMRILHIEDDETISAMVKEMLEIEGWTVETIRDGKEALAKISGDYRYHLFLIDYDLPSINGLEIVHRVRNLPHRVTTPIVVLSAMPVEAAAREAGADVFLQKPQDVNSLVETVSRLLGEGQEDS